MCTISWPPSISLSNRIINKNNDGSLILQNDSFIPKALSDQQDFRIPTSIINDQKVVQNPSSICLATNNISVTISPALPNLITSSAFCCPTRFIPESVKTAVSNRVSYCFTPYFLLFDCHLFYFDYMITDVVQ
ncbi:unnamed protein product [Schistosoma mattheei]|uniref:Uncharacterized protein n=1 Tax=Schistosoma mattheei TaxID=31246 RepID=A0A183Q3A0_9TREM|nr:unnamed protein product [Schistosoma mattheei]